MFIEVGFFLQFTEKCFNIAKTFLFGASGFQTTVGGLYLLYALFSKQLFEPKVKVSESKVLFAV